MNHTQEAIDRVARNAGIEWQNYAVGVIRRVAAKAHSEKREITADDIITQLTIAPHDWRALGPAIKRAQREGVLQFTGKYQQSTRQETQRQPLRVWQCFAA